MKHIFTTIFTLLSLCNISQAQITITASDMPVNKDTLRYSIVASLGTAINLADTGTGISWNYSDLVPIAQNVDTYRKATDVSFLYFLISSSAYGYKVADSLPGLSMVLPVPITNIYTFFEKKTSPNCFAAVAFAAEISGIPTPANYSQDDIWYRFPLNYGNVDSANFALNFSLASVGSIKMAGTRKNRVDGWGTIQTPYFTTPTNCIRVRSEVNEVDSVAAGTVSFGIPRTYVDYKWLVNGTHYPALWVNTNIIAGIETISSIRYFDSYRDLSTAGIAPGTQNQYHKIVAYPIPAINKQVQLNIPPTWNNYTVEIFDVQSKLVLHTSNNNKLNLSELPSGTYIARIINGSEIGYASIEL